MKGHGKHEFQSVLTSRFVRLYIRPRIVRGKKSKLTSRLDFEFDI